MSQWLLLDFTCPEHGEFENLCDRREGRPQSHPCQAETSAGTCDKDSPVVSSYAVPGRLKHGEISQSKSAYGDMPPWVMRTESLADGEDAGEWKKRESKRLKEATKS